MAHTFLGIDSFSSTPASSGHGVWTDGTSTDDNDARDAASANLNAEAAINRSNWCRWHMINWIDGGTYTATTTISTANNWRFSGNNAIVGGGDLAVGLSGLGGGTISVGAFGAVQVGDGGFVNVTASTTFGGVNFTGTKTYIGGIPFLHGELIMGIASINGLQGNIGYGFATGRSTTGTQPVTADHILAPQPGVLITWTLGAPSFGGPARNRRLVLSRISGASDPGGIIINNVHGVQIAKLNQGTNVEGHLILEWLVTSGDWHVVGQSGNVSVTGDSNYP